MNVLKIALLFAGQGAQFTGMGKSLYENSNEARLIFDIADKLRPGTSAQCFSADSATLSKTENTQPCIFTVDLAAAKAVAEQGIKISAVAGFSLGELPAIAFSEILAVEKAFSLTLSRASFMSKAAYENPGEMAAILKLSGEVINEVCENIGGVWAVNYNSPAQTVIAGNQQSISQATEKLTLLGGKVVKLAVSGAFHCPHMTSAGEQMLNLLSKTNFSEPLTPIYSNVTAKPYSKELISDLLSQQIYSPVKWQQTIEHMTASGIDTFIEVGPGKTLSGLVRRISPGAKCFNVCEYEEILKVDNALNANK